MKTLFAIFTAVAFAASAQAQLVLKAGADGTVYEPSPVRMTSAVLTTPTISGATLTTPNIGVATATSVNKITLTAPATGATLTLADGSSLITSGAYAITLTSTATTGLTLPTTGTLATLAGSEALTNKSLAATGAVTSSSPSAKIGYATGAGGAATQGTSRTTTVVMVPNPCTSGSITTTADSIAALGLATFTVTDSAVSATDVVILSKISGDVDTFAWVSNVGAGSFAITLRNSHATDADTTAFVLNFAVIKAVAN